MSLWEGLRGALIVSCQAGSDEPLHGAAIMAAMARAAVEAGARAIRAESPGDVAAIRATVAVPVIGLYKQRSDHPVYITPSFAAAAAIARAGATAIALDATTLTRPDGLSLEATIRRIHEELGLPVMADVSTLEEGLRSVGWGADAVGTTLAGYTPQSRAQEGPDFRLLTDLVAQVRVPVIMEGRIWEPAQARLALELGAHAVVVGSAITRPQLIAARYVKEMSHVAP